MADAKERRARKKSDSFKRPHSDNGDCGAVSELWKLPLHGCWVNRNLEETGWAFLYVNRLRETGGMVGAGFLVDLWGVGVKDCFQTRDVPMAELKSFGAAKLFGGRMTECSEERARRLVWGGFWRAKAMGFRLPGQFQYCGELLKRLEEQEIDAGLFGKNGKRRSTEPDLEREDLDLLVEA